VLLGTAAFAVLWVMARAAVQSRVVYVGEWSQMAAAVDPRLEPRRPCP
jgi:hypothetical protein